MEKREYRTPRVYELGRVEDLTQIPGFNKCAGSGDAFMPLENTQTDFTMDACPPLD